MRRDLLPPPLKGNTGPEALHGPRKRFGSLRARPGRASRHDRPRDDRRVHAGALRPAQETGHVGGVRQAHARMEVGRALRGRGGGPVAGVGERTRERSAVRPTDGAVGDIRRPGDRQARVVRVENRGHAARVRQLQAEEHVVRVPGARAGRDRCARGPALRGRVRADEEVQTHGRVGEARARDQGQERPDQAGREDRPHARRHSGVRGGRRGADARERA